MDRIDLLCLVLLVLAGATASWIGADRVNAEGSCAANVWFQADVGHVYESMTLRRSDHYRTKVHPVFSIATNPPVKVLNKAGLDKERAVRTVMATAAGLWLAILYGVLRAFGLRRPDAVVFAGLAAVSYSAVFWSTVPETYIFGSTTLLLLMGFATYAWTRKLASGWFVGFSALSLSMTVTNWMAGLLVTRLNNPWRRSVRITLDAFLLITLVWGVQQACFPNSQFFLLSLEERRYMLVEAAGGLAERLTGFFLHPMVMPVVQVLENPWQPAWPLFSVQFAPIGSTGALGPHRWAVLATGAVLALGASINNVDQFARVTSELSRSECHSEASESSGRSRTAWERALEGWPQHPSVYPSDSPQMGSDCCTAAALRQEVLEQEEGPAGQPPAGPQEIVEHETGLIVGMQENLNDPARPCEGPGAFDSRITGRIPC